MHIPQSVINLIKERANLVEVVSESVTLKRSGSRLVGLCPFHSEKTPSFHVNEAEGFYHCFGCGAHGDAIRFVSETRSFSFPQAVRFLAGRYGVPLPEQRAETEEEKAAKRLRSLMRGLFVAVAGIYRSELKSSRSAQAYLKERGISPETAETFGIGFAPEEWDFLLPKLLEKDDGVLPKHEAGLLELLELGGLVKFRAAESKAKGSHFDMFRGRLIFPILRSDLVPIALGGRMITPNKKSPKYINSPETLIYKKRKTLFGLPQAVKSSSAERTLYLVEGYMDVISLYQSGIKNVVACCGTALTEDHIQVLRRVCDRVVFIFDGDKAGKKAAVSSYELLLGSGLESRIVVPEEGEDPDSLAKRLSANELKSFLEDSSMPASEFYFDCLLGGSSSPQAISRVAQQFISAIPGTVNPVEKDALLNQAAKCLGVSKGSLETLVARKASNSSGAAPQQVTSSSFGSQPLPSKTLLPASGGRQAAEFDASKRLRSVLSEEVSGEVSSGEQEGPRQLSEFETQIGVALICEPRLVREFGKLEVGHPGLVELIKLVSEASPAPLEDGEGAYTELIERAGLSDTGLLAEAKRQVAVGGARPDRIFEEAVELAESRGLRDKLEKLRVIEASDQGRSDDGLRLAQEKLAALRALKSRQSSQE